MIFYFALCRPPLTVTRMDRGPRAEGRGGVRVRLWLTMREQPIGLVRHRLGRGPVRSTSLVRCGLPQAVSSLRSPASYTRKLPAVRQRRRAQGMGACTARTCTPRETTVTHLRLQRGALPLAQQHPAQQQGLAGGRGLRGPQPMPPRQPRAGRGQWCHHADDHSLRAEYCGPQQERSR